MSRINIPKRINVHIDHFPDNQRHARVNPELLRPGVIVDVTATLASANDVMDFLSVTQVLKSAKVRLGDLYVPYLYGARSDRQFQLGDSVELELIAGLINDQHYETVSILDPHTYAAINLIHHSRIIRVRDRCPVPPLAGLAVAPDQHADNHVDSWVSLSTPHIQCKKTRIESAVVIEVPEHKPCDTYTVIDDICDGGATFIELAEKLNAPTLTLCVTHGVFSKGVDRLVRAGYSRIITTNSLSQFSHAHLTVLDVL